MKLTGKKALLPAVRVRASISPQRDSSLLRVPRNLLMKPLMPSLPPALR